MLYSSVGGLVILIAFIIVDVRSGRGPHRRRRRYGHGGDHHRRSGGQGALGHLPRIMENALGILGVIKHLIPQYGNHRNVRLGEGQKAIGSCRQVDDSCHPVFTQDHHSVFRSSQRNGVRHHRRPDQGGGRQCQRIHRQRILLEHDPGIGRFKIIQRVNALGSIEHIAGYGNLLTILGMGQHALGQSKVLDANGIQQFLSRLTGNDAGSRPIQLHLIKRPVGQAVEHGFIHCHNVCYSSAHHLGAAVCIHQIKIIICANIGSLLAVGQHHICQGAHDAAQGEGQHQRANQR